MKTVGDKSVLVNAVIAADRVFKIPSKKIANFIIAQKNDPSFFQNRNISQDKLTNVLIDLIKTKTQNEKVQQNSDSQGSFKSKSSEYLRLKVLA